jgi:hypothetical protein
MPAMGAPNTSNIPAPMQPPPPPPTGLNVTAVNATHVEPHHAIRVIPVSGLPLIVTAKDEPKQQPLFHCSIGSKDEKCLIEEKEKDEHLHEQKQAEEGKRFAHFELEHCNAEDPNQLQVVMLTDDRFNEENRQAHKPLTPTEYLIGCTSKLPLLGGRTAYKVEPQFRRVGRNKFINYMRKRNLEFLKPRQDDDDIVEEEEEEIILLSPSPQYALQRQSEEQRLNFLDIKSPSKRYIGNAPDHHNRWGARCAQFGDVDGVACSHEQLHRNMQFMKVNQPAFTHERRRELDQHLFKRETMSENGVVHPAAIKKRSLLSGHSKAIKMYKRQQEIAEEDAKMDYVRRWAEGDARPRSFEPLDGPLLLQRDFDDDDEYEAPAFMRRHLDEDNVWESQPVFQKRNILETRSPKKPPGAAGFNNGPRPMIKRSLSENGLEKRFVEKGDADIDWDKRSKFSNKNRGPNNFQQNRFSKRDLQDLEDGLDKRSNKGGWRGGSNKGSHGRFRKRHLSTVQDSSKLTRRAVSESGKDDINLNLQKRGFEFEDEKLEARSIGTTHGGHQGVPAAGRNNAVGTGGAAVANNVAAAPAAAGQLKGRVVKRDVGSEEPVDINDDFEKRSDSHRGRGPYNSGRWKKRDLMGTNDEQDDLEKRSNGNSYSHRRWKRSNPDDVALQKRQVSDLEGHDNAAWEKRSDGSGKKWRNRNNGYNGYRYKREEAENLNNPALVKRAFSENGKDDMIVNLQKRNQYWAGHWGAGGGGGEGMRKRHVLNPKELHRSRNQLQELLMEHGTVHDLLELDHAMESDQYDAKRGPKSWNGHGSRSSSFGPRRVQRGWRRWHHGLGPRPRSPGHGPPEDDYWGHRDLEFDDDDAMTIRSALTTHGDIFPKGVEDFAKSEVKNVQKRDTTAKANIPVLQKRDAVVKTETPTVQKRDTVASAAWNWAMKKLLK